MVIHNENDKIKASAFPAKFNPLLCVKIEERLNIRNCLYSNKNAYTFKDVVKKFISANDYNV